VGRVTSWFGWRRDPFTGRLAFHHGIDIGAPTGTDVCAAKAGTVSFTGWHGGLGKTVIVDHGGGLETRYAHLSQILVSEGQGVSQGAVIGKVGNTGRSTGPHLHFEVRRDGEAVNPVDYYPSGG